MIFHERSTWKIVTDNQAQTSTYTFSCRHTMKRHPEPTQTITPTSPGINRQTCHLKDSDVIYPAESNQKTVPAMLTTHPRITQIVLQLR